MAVRAKFYVAEVTKYATAKVPDGWAQPVPWGKVILRAVTRKQGDNEQWASATPSGSMEMTVSGAAFPWFEEHIGEDLLITLDTYPDEGE